MAVVEKRLDPVLWASSPTAVSGAVEALPASAARALRGSSFARALNNCLHTASQGPEDVVLTVRGHCMSPVLKDGSTVNVRPNRGYLTGDIVAYYCPHQGTHFIHRCLGVVRAGGAWKYLMMADQAARPDTLVDRSNILGCVVKGRVGIVERSRALCRYVSWSVRLLLAMPRS